jgi:hypothetical protein
MFTLFLADPVGIWPGRVYLDYNQLREASLTITPAPWLIFSAIRHQQAVDKIDHHRS